MQVVDLRVRGSSHPGSKRSEGGHIYGGDGSGIVGTQAGVYR